MEETLNIRLAGIEDAEAVNQLYNTVYGANRSAAQFRWEFFSAPAGPSVYVVAERNGMIIGTQAAIPYHLVDSSGRVFLTAKSEDTLVSPQERGKQIFEKMYALLIDECRKRGMESIWGFTYADKPFRRLGFEIPYSASMGLLVNDVTGGAAYFSRLASQGTD